MLTIFFWQPPVPIAEECSFNGNLLDPPFNSPPVVNRKGRGLGPRNESRQRADIRAGILVGPGSSPQAASCRRRKTGQGRLHLRWKMTGLISRRRSARSGRDICKTCAATRSLCLGKAQPLGPESGIVSRCSCTALIVISLLPDCQAPASIAGLRRDPYTRWIPQSTTLLKRESWPMRIGEFHQPIVILCG